MTITSDLRVFESPSAVCDAVGEHLGVSSWRDVTQAQVNLFADATGDHQWIHVDEARGAEGPFGGTIAHGFLTLALIPVLQQEIFRVDRRAFGVNYGLDRVRFPAPVRVGSRVRLDAELVAASTTPLGVRATIRCVIEIEGHNKPAVVADAISLYAPE